jgi:hypothetical protein
MSKNGMLDFVRGANTVKAGSEEEMKELVRKLRERGLGTLIPKYAKAFTYDYELHLASINRRPPDWDGKTLYVEIQPDKEEAGCYAYSEIGQKSWYGAEPISAEEL